MASPAHRWTPADAGVTVPQDNLARVGLLDTLIDIQAQQQRDAQLMWGAGAVILIALAVAAGLWARHRRARNLERRLAAPPR